ncbi:MAG: PIN domain nuclease [Candidatus Latescibacterota bacterium]
MMVVDSNAWADYFNGVEAPHVARLSRALEEEEDLAVIPIIITEVLQGFRSDSGFRQARDVLLPLVFDPTLDCHVRAAQLFRDLRRTGSTVRGAVDCIIAQVCLDMDATLLSPDVDFDRIARRTPLRLWREGAE